MFKRLKRIEELLTKILKANEDGLKIVECNNRVIEARLTAEAAPFKCRRPECDVVGIHAHVIIDTSPNDAAGESKRAD